MLRPARVIPYCAECKTSFAVKCIHVHGKDAGKSKTTWEVDQVDQEIP